MPPPPVYVYTQRMPGDVPGAVRSLLLSTKQLQEALRLWSIGQASETQVSDIYVQIGTQFNATIHAFAYHKIDLRFVSSHSLLLPPLSPASSFTPLSMSVLTWYLLLQ